MRVFMMPIVVFLFLFSISFQSPSMASDGLSRGIEAGLEKALRAPSGVFYTSLTNRNLLSETVGLEMFLALVSGDRERFARQAALVEELYLAPTDLLYWRLDREGKPTDPSNAAIDDLRVCRVLLAASRRWKEPEWAETAHRVGKALLDHCTVEGLLADNTSWREGALGKKVHSPRPYLTLSYGDVSGMLALADQKGLEGWGAVAQRTLGVLVLGLNGKRSPYWGYDAEEGRYDHSDNNLINEMLFLLHLARVGVVPPELGSWWEVYRKSGRVPLSGGGENVAVEALLALVLAEAGMTKEAREVVLGLARFRIELGEARGLLGYCEPGGRVSAWAFDNLLALAAIQMTVTEGGSE